MVKTLQSVFSGLFQPTEESLMLAIQEAEESQQTANNRLTSAQLALANFHYKANRCPYCKTSGELWLGPQGGCAQNVHCGSCGEAWNTLAGEFIVSFMAPKPALRARYEADKTSTT